MEHNPFLLTLEICDCTDTEAVVYETLVGRRLRFTTKIAKQVSANFKRLREGGSSKVENQFNEVQMQKSREPQEFDYVKERRAAGVIDGLLVGFGPKLSRNLWQWLGLTRYEIPIDSRVVKWINSQKLTLTIEKEKLGNAEYHESLLDHIRALCVEAGCLPCVLDAAISSVRKRPMVVNSRDEDSLLMFNATVRPDGYSASSRKFSRKRNNLALPSPFERKNNSTEYVEI